MSKIKDYKKIGIYSFKFFLIILSIVLIQIFFDGFEKEKLKNFPLVLLFLSSASLVMGLIIWLIDLYYLPKRRIKLYNKLVQTYNGKKVSEDTIHFQVNEIDFFIHVSVQIELSETVGGFEKIGFYIPKKQIDELQTKPTFTYKYKLLNGMPCYRVYETNGWGISLSKKYIFKRMNMIKNPT